MALSTLLEQFRSRDSTHVARMDAEESEPERVRAGDRWCCGAGMARMFMIPCWSVTEAWPGAILDKRPLVFNPSALETIQALVH